MRDVEELIELFAERGGSQYGGEAVTQLEHALQAALLAEQDGASDELVVAALVHDVGHLLHELPDEAPDAGVDDRHERSGANSLRKLFPDAVVEPIQMHVDAKRCLCAVDPDYRNSLSQPSLVSLHLQGGPMTEDEAAEFMRRPFADDALRLRRWDDRAKTAGLPTPPLSSFEERLRRVSLRSAT
jgi:phosphonate degradation associated HDIG domain protein